MASRSNRWVKYVLRTSAGKGRKTWNSIRAANAQAESNSVPPLKTLNGKIRQITNEIKKWKRMPTSDEKISALNQLNEKLVKLNAEKKNAAMAAGSEARLQHLYLMQVTKANAARNRVIETILVDTAIKSLALNHMLSINEYRALHSLLIHYLRQKIEVNKRTARAQRKAFKQGLSEDNQRKLANLAFMTSDYQLGKIEALFINQFGINAGHRMTRNLIETLELLVDMLPKRMPEIVD